MFMQQYSPEFGVVNNNSAHNENVCWLMPKQPSCNASRYKSSYSAKVRWDCWLEKKGCCKTIGPPPKVYANCPEHYLKRHSRQVPVFFAPKELRQDKRLVRTVYGQDIRSSRKRSPRLKAEIRVLRSSQNDENCPFPPPPSNLGLFRGPTEPSYEEQYRIRRPTSCVCDRLLWNELLQATECAGVMAARMKGRVKPIFGESEAGTMKDYIRSNAVNAIRMPARRLRRCYLNQCGVHLIDMSDSPFVLRSGFGKVPPYIYRRKMELLEKDLEAKRRMDMREQTEDAKDIQMVDEREKAMVIKGLKDYWTDLLHQYNNLPLLHGQDNERHRDLKQGLEERMKEVETDLQLLTSSSTLYVGDVKKSHFL